MLFVQHLAIFVLQELKVGSRFWLEETFFLNCVFIDESKLSIAELHFSLNALHFQTEDQNIEKRA